VKGEKMKKFVFIALFVTMLCIIGQAEAAVISGITVTSDMGEFSSAGALLINMVNNSGLTGTGFSATHDAADNTGWKSPVGVTSGTVTFNLNGLYALSSFAVWNHAQLNGDRGVQSVTIETSTDGVNFQPCLGCPAVFAKKTSAPVSAEIFDFSLVEGAYVDATHVRFNIANGYGAVNTGLLEVMFDGVTPYFSDVHHTHWAFEYIQSIYEDGITSGYQDGTYRPTNKVTRAEMAAFIKRTIDLIDALEARVAELEALHTP
jgi:hypothetical protein